MREKIGAFKNLLGINGHPRGQKRGQRHASMPAGTFVGPPNALESQRTQERSLSLPADEESMAPEPPVDPALLERADDGPQSPGISHEDSLEFLAQFEANLPQSLRGWLGAREPGVPYLPSNQDPTLAPSPLPAPPGTVDPRLITSSPNEAGSPWMVGSLPEDDNALVLGSSPEQHNALIEAQNFIQQTDYDDINNFPELGDLYDSNDFSQFPF